MSKLPDGWKNATLADIAASSYGLVDGPFGSNLKSSEYAREGIPVIRGSNLSVGEGYFYDDGFVFVSETKANELIRSNCKRGDIIFTKKGTLGQTGFIPHSSRYDRYLLSSNQMKMTVDVKNADPFYVYSYVSSPRAVSKILNDASSTGVPQINLGYLRSFPIPLPPLAEQRKIAEILSTWDEAIQLVESLIAAMKERKRGLMQRLLTGEVRFPGFDGEWEEVRLGDVFDRVTRTVNDESENVLSITAGVGFVDQGKKFGRVIAGKNLERYIKLLRGEFAYNKGNSNLYPQGCIYRLEEYEEGAVPNVYYCFTPSAPHIVGDFYRHYFESGALNGKLRPLINSGVRNDGLLNLSADAFFGIEVVVPSPEEQHEMASFFDMVTDEIRNQQMYLNHLREQKKGLMQRLLTGEVRVGV